MSGKRRPRRRPATTVEGREGQVVSIAIDLAEKQILDGTASSQVITHFLKLGSSREKLEQARLDRENKLLDAKVEALASAQRMEELYADALAAMKSYQGEEVTEVHDDD
jgi:hypothetical protein